MNTSILVLSRCQKVSKYRNNLIKYSHFHFKGVYKGVILREIRVVGSSNPLEMFLKGEDYILLLSVLKIEGDVLYGKQLKSKMIV